MRTQTCACRSPSVRDACISRPTHGTYGEDDLPAQLGRAEWLRIEPLGCPAERGHAQTLEQGDLASRRDRCVPVRGQERGQRREHLLGSRLGDPMADAGDAHSLHDTANNNQPVIIPALTNWIATNYKETVT